jgi:hypothetical protein
VRIGIAHHLGWAVAVSAADDHRVVDRRRIPLVGEGVAAAPVHHEGKPLSDAQLSALVAEVRASALRTSAAALDALARSLPGPVVSVSIRGWPADFPADIARQRRTPYEARADSVMYLEVLAEVTRVRGWELHLYDAREVEAEAARILGDRADAVLRGPRAQMGPPWSADHRMALGATVLASVER